MTACRVSAAVSLSVLCLSAVSLAAPPMKQPHIVFVLADDLGYADVPFTLAGSNVVTPTLSKLAAEGVVLDNALVNPICTPTRTSLMSGYYPIHAGLQHGVILDAVPDALPIEFNTTADHLKALGYTTKIVGKWHCGYHQYKYTPQYRGFDSFYGYYTGNEEYWNHTSPCWHCGVNFTALDLHNATQAYDNPVRDKAGVYSANLFTTQAVDIVNSHDPDTPLFLYLPYESVHGAASCTPDCNDPVGDLLQAPDSYIDQQSQIPNLIRRKFAGMVGALDDGVKNVTEALQAKGMWDNTLFIFSTDNGAPNVHFNGEAMSNGANLRGGKGTLWDGGMKAAAFVWGSMLSKKAYRNTGLTHVSDWLPTLVHVAGGKLEKDVEGPFAGTDPIVGRGDGGLDGYNVWEMISEDAASPRTEILHNIDPIQHTAALRVGKYKLVVGSSPASWYPMANSTSYPGPIHPKDPPKDRVWLFDMEADPAERTNLASSNPAQLKIMFERLAAYNATAVPFQNGQTDLQAVAVARAAGDVWMPWQKED